MVQYRWHDVLVGDKKECVFYDYAGQPYVGVSGCSAVSFCSAGYE